MVRAYGASVCSSALMDGLVYGSRRWRFGFSGFGVFGSWAVLGYGSRGCCFASLARPCGRVRIWVAPTALGLFARPYGRVRIWVAPTALRFARSPALKDGLGYGLHLRRLVCLFVRSYGWVESRVAPTAPGFCGRKCGVNKPQSGDVYPDPLHRRCCGAGYVEALGVP